VKFAELVAIMVDAELAKLQGSHSDERRDLTSFPEAKLIRVKKDTVIGQHYHLKKEERFVLSEGQAMLVLGTGLERTQWPMEIGRVYTVSPGQYHEFRITRDSVLIGLNSHPYDPADDYRIVRTRRELGNREPGNEDRGHQRLSTNGRSGMSSRICGNVART